jgi:trigger factor
MSDNETSVAEQGTEVEEPAFLYPIKVEDVGPAAKKVTVEIPHDRIISKLDEQFKELRKQAAIPGFRVGHAPRKLLEKRFSQSVKDQVASDLVRESYQQALKNNDLKIIGDPEFENQEAIKLPEDGPLNYTFSVEVQPNITLPDFAAMKVKKPKITVTEANVDQAMQNLREQQGTLVPVEDRGVEAGDYLTADVHVKVDGKVIGHTQDGQIVVRPGRIGGLQIDDLDKQLAGAKSEEIRTIRTKAPDTHPSEEMRDKEIEIEVSVKDIKRLELADISETFLEDLGFTNAQELRDALREQMDEKIDLDIQQAMREQVNKFLLENTQVDLPAKMSSQQADRVVNRRAMDLVRRGLPKEQIAANIDKLKAGAQDEGARELKLFFILQKIAGDMEVDVSEAELNGQVAYIAAQNDERPETVKQNMQKDGSLQNLYVQMREQKAVDQILTKAQIEEVEMTPQQGEAAAAPAASEEAKSEEATPQS